MYSRTAYIYICTSRIHYTAFTLTKMLSHLLYCSENKYNAFASTKMCSRISYNVLSQSLHCFHIYHNALVFTIPLSHSHTLTSYTPVFVLTFTLMHSHTHSEHMARIMTTQRSHIYRLFSFAAFCLKTDTCPLKHSIQISHQTLSH